MKKKLSFLIVGVLMSALAATAQTSDADYVSNWILPPDGNTWMNAASFPLPQNHAYKQIYAKEITDPFFNPEEADFDQWWASIPTEHPIATGINPQNAKNRKGAADFTGSMKVAYDENSIYILFQATDDHVTGDETIEIMWAPYVKIDPLITKYPENPHFGYFRYTNFGAYKAVFGKAGFSGAMTITGQADGKVKLDWGGPVDLIKSNSSTIEKSVAGTGVFKRIVALGYSCFTGPQRPTFNKDIWKSLVHEKGKGISFDIKFSDNDGSDDETVTNENGGDYWWNTTDNNGYALTAFSGFLGMDIQSSVKKVDAEPVFGNVTKDRIEFLMPVDVNVYSTLGKLVHSAVKTDVIDLNTLDKGIYLVSAKGQTIKVIR